MIRAISLSVALFLAGASSADEALGARERLLAAAGLVEAAETAGDRIAALTDAVRAYDAGLSAMRSEIRSLVLKERQIERQLSSEDSEISSLLAMMQNASRRAEAESLLHPGSALDTIRAGTLTSAVVPALQDRAAELEGQLRELEDIKAVVATAQDGLIRSRAEVQRARAALAEALAARTDLPPRLATNEAAMEALVNSADTLSVLADSLFSGEERRPGNGGSRWSVPVAGKIVTVDGGSDTRPGWSMITEPKALVVAPTDASVRFSREIEREGTVVVLEADAGRLVLFAGLSNSFVSPGQVLDRGEAVGFAGTGNTGAQDNLNVEGVESSLLPGETVYMEIRQGGAPVDPVTVLTMEKEQG